MANNTRSKTFGTGDPRLDLAAGLIPGIRSRSANGVNLDLDTGVEETLWNVGGLYTGPTAAQTLTLVSDNAADDGVTGQGAQKIKITGLTSFESAAATIEETVVLDGLTPVVTMNEFVFFCFAKVTEHGTTAVNTGTITITATDDATVQSQIDPLTGVTRSCVCGVPAGQSMFITNYEASILQGSANSEVDVRLAVDQGQHLDLLPTSSTLIHQIGLKSAGTSAFAHQFNPYIEIAGPAVVSLRATASANNITLSGSFDLVVTDNTEMRRLREARESR